MPTHGVQTMTRRFFKAVAGASAAAAIALSAALPASAAEPLAYQEHPPANQWEFEFRPYAWILFMNGDTSFGAATADIDTNLFDLIDDSDELYAFMSYQEARKGRLGLYSDIFWSKINVGGSTVINERPIPALDVNIVADANVWATLAIVEGGAAYEIFGNKRPVGSFKDPQGYSSTAVDLLVGTRYWYIKPEVDLDVTATVSIPALNLSRTGAGRVSGEETYDWWDPFVGLRLRHSPAPGKELFVKGDIGGFGAGSDFSWQAAAGYSFNTRILGHDMTSYVGYRALYVDYEEGSGARRFGLELLTHGPILGASFKW